MLEIWELIQQFFFITQILQFMCYDFSFWVLLGVILSFLSHFCNPVQDFIIVCLNMYKSHPIIPRAFSSFISTVNLLKTTNILKIWIWLYFSHDNYKVKVLMALCCLLYSGPKVNILCLYLPIIPFQFTSSKLKYLLCFGLTFSCSWLYAVFYTKYIDIEK